MKLGQNLFKKDQSLWGKPLIAYDDTKMNALFSEMHQAENSEAVPVRSTPQGPEVSLETELYLMLHS
ncbi:hypothetical protein FGM00_18115 [Aggregatimonas sangjinii]|uniref:Uncharacterized protein n=1 Tax=Aggregatimonas sangjinii TaxID=2583587 RepID=A0A5B7STD9_9FLAO|nr:hypothetical protein [Aggregatimonas sangjinii]QCX01936.1 hypothetical protein FGM00_18115 [Aggregatimonas sangjinii]